MIPLAFSYCTNLIDIFVNTWKVWQRMPNQMITFVSILLCKLSSGGSCHGGCSCNIQTLQSNSVHNIAREYVTMFVVYESP
jgi:hypothetical protein